MSERDIIYAVTAGGDVVVPDLTDGFGWQTPADPEGDPHYQMSHWSEIRNTLLGDAMQDLVEHNRRYGASVMDPDSPAARKLDNQYPGGRPGVANRSDMFYRRFADKLRLACGACALRSECVIVDNPESFRQKHPKAQDHAKFKTRLRRDPSSAC